MAGASSQGPRGSVRLGDLLLQAKVINNEQLQRALAEQQKWGGRLGRALVDLGFVNEQTMNAALAHHLRLPYFDFDKTPPPANVVELLSVQACERLGVMPVGADLARQVIRVATSEPTDQDLLRDLAQLTGSAIEVVVASASDIDRAVRRYYYGDVRQTSSVSMPGFVGAEGTKARDEPRPSPSVSTLAAAEALSAAASASAIGSAAAAGTAELGARVAKLEEITARQTLLIRALVEQLAETKTLDLEAFQKRVRGR